MARLRLLDRPELLNSGGNVVHLTGSRGPADTSNQPRAFRRSATSRMRAARRWRFARSSFGSSVASPRSCSCTRKTSSSRGGQGFAVARRRHPRGRRLPRLRVRAEPGEALSARAQSSDFSLPPTRPGSSFLWHPCSWRASWLSPSLRLARRIGPQAAGWGWLGQHGRWLLPTGARRWGSSVCLRAKWHGSSHPFSTRR